jgi:hypothetical protein
VQHDGDVARQLAGACFAAFSQGAWHAATARKLAPPNPIADQDFTVRPQAIRSAGRCMAA